LVSCFL